MVSQLPEGHVEWTMAAPLWTLAGDPTIDDNRLRFRTPTILRFATDSFMQEFNDLLNTEPQRLNEFVAAPETWNSPPDEPAPPVQKAGLALALFRARNAAVRRLQAQGRQVVGASQTTQSSAATKPLKLYQPVHQRFYLVTTCLVCRMLGLPDRKIDAGAQEKASFVLRLLQPRATANLQQPDPRDCNECALVNGAWRAVADPESFVPGEEQHPLSPAAYTQDDQRRRRLLVGLIPVGDRERLLQATQPNPAQVTPSPLLDARNMMVKVQVIGPISSLEDMATSAYDSTQKENPGDPDPSPAAQQQIVARANGQLQQISWYILLDFARYLETNVNFLWLEIHNGGTGADLPSQQQPLWKTLSQTAYKGTSMMQALKQAYDDSKVLENATTTYQPGATGWPGFLFQFYSVSTTGVQGLQPALDRPTLESQIVQALPAVNPNPALPVRLVAQANANPQGPVWFAIRCVLERPNCGSLAPPLVSEPTQAFQLAAFFDPDAPARPIRIGLPIDTTPAGLRKFDKNTAFVMSDVLCGQVSKMTASATFADLVLSVLPFPFKKDLSGGGGSPCGDASGGFGMVCSFSIPIITICALILLIIFVKLLDIIFFWMPFFQICLPLPKFSAKDS
jgi:hypothetical protein